MQLDGLDLGEADICGTALALLAAFGDKAASLAQEQVEKSIPQSDTAERWQRVTAAIVTLMRVNVYMELALDLLDSVGETSAPPHLDAAIVKLGFRSAEENGVRLVDAGIEHDERYFHERAEHHLQLAEAEPDTTGKGLHLNIASRYATLRELAGRTINSDAAPQARLPAASS